MRGSPRLFASFYDQIIKVTSRVEANLALIRQKYCYNLTVKTRGDMRVATHAYTLRARPNYFIYAHSYCGTTAPRQSAAVTL